MRIVFCRVLIDALCPMVCPTHARMTASQACKPPVALRVACLGQPLANVTGQDGTPVTFNWPVVMSTVKAEHFQWGFPDGSTRRPGCAIRNGNPAGEGNEGQTVAIVGDSGGWDAASATSLEITGDLMLVAPNGTQVSAKGLSYRGPALNYSNGITLLTAEYEVFSAAGEQAKPANVFPNHCRALFPGTTHRIRMVFDGGVTLDGRRPITPDRTDLVEVRDSAHLPLPPETVLGLADLGATVPQSACDKDSYVTDGDNFLDLCLKLAGDARATPASIYLHCGKDTQISAPKGLGYPCKPQLVNITSAGSD